MVTVDDASQSRCRSGDRQCPAGAYLASFDSKEQRYTPARSADFAAIGDFLHRGRLGIYPAAAWSNAAWMAAKRSSTSSRISRHPLHDVAGTASGFR
jgi:hypothetical protein